MEVAVAASPVCNEDTSVEQLKIPWIPSPLMMTFKALPHLKVPTMQAKYERHLRDPRGLKNLFLKPNWELLLFWSWRKRMRSEWLLLSCWFYFIFIFYENFKFMKTFHFLWKLYFLWKLQNPSWIMILKMKQNNHIAFDIDRYFFLNFTFHWYKFGNY